MVSTLLNNFKLLNVIFSVFFCCILLPHRCLSQSDIDTIHHFLPQQKIIFSDDFSVGTQGGFPDHWKLTGPCNQIGNSTDSKFCTIQKTADTAALQISPTDGLENYIQPDIKAVKYLPDSFTLEYDFMLQTRSSSADLYFNYDESCIVQAFEIYNKGNMTFILDNNAMRELYDDGVKKQETYRYQQRISNEADVNKWHHFALSFNHRIIACYVDDNLILHIPDCGYSPSRFILTCGNSSPVLFSNIRLATGDYITQQAAENMNVLLTENKFVTHAILFDVNKAVIQPKSMSFIRKLTAFLKKHPDIRLEIDGHTDDAGTPARNQQLSEQRAAAVKKLLVTSGIVGNRLSVKGFGSSRPVSTNTTEKGKADNRRVEFIKK